MALADELMTGIADRATVDLARDAPVATGPIGGSPARRAVGALGRWLSRWWAVIGVLLGWQLWVVLAGYNHIVLPTPIAVFVDLVTDPGAYAGDAARTLSMATLGLVAGMAIGFAAAVSIWASPLLAGVVSPVALTMRSIPIVAVIPVVARVLGYGNQLVPVVTILLAFFPAYVMTGSGLRSASPTSIDLMRALGASRWTILRRVLVPSAVPNLLVALRLSAASTVLVAMVAEFLAGTSGLGRLFATARTRYDTPRAWGAAMLATIASVALFQAAVRLERLGRSRFR